MLTLPKCAARHDHSHLHPYPTSPLHSRALSLSLSLSHSPPPSPTPPPPSTSCPHTTQTLPVMGDAKREPPRKPPSHKEERSERDASHSDHLATNFCPSFTSGDLSKRIRPALTRRMGPCSTSSPEIVSTAESMSSPICVSRTECATYTLEQMCKVLVEDRRWSGCARFTFECRLLSAHMAHLCVIPNVRCVQHENRYADYRIDTRNMQNLCETCAKFATRARRKLQRRLSCCTQRLHTRCMTHCPCNGISRLSLLQHVRFFATPVPPLCVCERMSMYVYICVGKCVPAYLYLCVFARVW